MKPLPSHFQKSSWSRAVPGQMLTLCLIASPAVPTQLDADAARRAEIANAFNDTFTGRSVNDAGHVKIAQSGGGGAGFQINRFRVK
jgi:hypothetical protein